MSAAWLTVLLVGGFTMLLKAAGPVALGGRSLPDRVIATVDLVGPALLAALVVTAVFSGPTGVTADTRIVGLAAAVVAVLLRAPLLLVVVAAAASTAAVRLWT